MKEHQSSPREAGPDAETDPVWRAFIDPPDEARPRAWWHWMDGNVDPAGIVRDLRWLHDVGVRGVQVFDGGMGGPLVVPAPVRPGSEAWDEAVDTAKRTASELGMELAVATSSGWSAAGGPWVEPADAMKKVVWSESVVSGGGIVEVELPPLPAVPGLYQDCPRWGVARDGVGWATDWRVLAFPADPLALDVADPARRPRLGADRRLVVPDRRIVRPHARAAAGPRWLVDGVDRAGVRRSRHRPLGRRRVAGPARFRRGAAGIRGAAGERRRRRVPGCRGAAA